VSGQDIWVLVEITHQGAVADIALEMLGGARQLATSTGGQVVALVLGHEVGEKASALPADRAIVVDDAQLAAFTPAPFVAAVAQALDGAAPHALLVGSTSIGLDVGPAVAAQLDWPVVSGCRAVVAAEGALNVTASFCAGKMTAEVNVPRPPAVLLVMPGAMPAAESGSPQVETKSVALPAEPGPIQFEQMNLPEAGDVDITQEEVLIGIGRGIGQEDNMEVVEELAELLGGQLCASRPIVDQGWLPTTRQVGKSGMRVKPKCYFALGMSGAPEHVEGMVDSDLIIAVNTDPNSPIFEVAHFGVVGDLLDVVPAISEAARSRSGA